MTMYARKFGHMRKKYQRNTNKEEMDVETPQKKKNENNWTNWILRLSGHGPHTVGIIHCNDEI